MREIDLSLSFYEVLNGAMVGVMRNTSAIFGNRKNKYGLEEHNWNFHIEAACSEYGTAKHTGKFWHTNIGGIGGDDVGLMHVRQTAYGKSAWLRLHPDDLDDKVFILATGVAPHYCLRGWLHAGDGKLEKYWSDPTGKNRYAFFVPQSLLHDMDTLP